MGHETTAKNLKEVEELIAKAIKKVGVKRENDLCHYIPMSAGGYMHHFTFKKWKFKQPGELASFLEKFILNADRPGRVAPKQRAPRGSRKRQEHQMFTRAQIDKMRNYAREAGDVEMLTLLSPVRSLSACKRELILSIKHGRVEPELWNTYVEAIHQANGPENE